jgi:hypothetical protein
MICGGTILVMENSNAERVNVSSIAGLDDMCRFTPRLLNLFLQSENLQDI